MADASIGAPAPMPFNFNDTQVRVVMRNDQPWFVAQDVCKALGYANTSKAISDHVDGDECSTITNSESRNGGGQLSIINESGLYALVLRSRKPQARKFAKWVTAEVLPSIRTTGGYNVQQSIPQAPTLMGRRFLLTLDGGQEQVTALAPTDCILNPNNISNFIRSGCAGLSRQQLADVAKACLDLLGGVHE